MAVKELLGLKIDVFYGIIYSQRVFYVSKAQTSPRSVGNSLFYFFGPYPPKTIKYLSLYTTEANCDLGNGFLPWTFKLRIIISGYSYF